MPFSSSDDEDHEECGKENCCRDIGDGGIFCRCNQFWCNRHSHYVIGSKCVKCNLDPSESSENLFDDCFIEICPYGTDCQRMMIESDSHPEHNDRNLSDITLGKALKKCLEIHGMECFEIHNHDITFSFAFSLPSMKSWIASRNAIEALNRY